MTKQNDGGPAYPQRTYQVDASGALAGYVDSPGMTLRERLAVAALGGLVGRGHLSFGTVWTGSKTESVREESCRAVAGLAVELADATLVALGHGTPDRLTWRPMEDPAAKTSMDVLANPRGRNLLPFLIYWTSLVDGEAAGYWRSTRTGNRVDERDFLGWIPVPQGGDDDGD